MKFIRRSGRILGGVLGTMPSRGRGSHGSDSRAGISQEPPTSPTGDGGADAGEAQSPNPPPDPPQLPPDGPKDCGEADGESQHNGPEQPSKFDRDLKKTDVFIAVFAGVSGVAAVFSTIAAVYTAGQIRGSSRQVDSAIAEIASAASAAQEEAFQLKVQADNTAKLIAPANRSANAAVQGVQQQARFFRLDERPIIERADCPPSDTEGNRYPATICLGNNANGSLRECDFDVVVTGDDKMMREILRRNGLAGQPQKQSKKH